MSIIGLFSNNGSKVDHILTFFLEGERPEYMTFHRSFNIEKVNNSEHMKRFQAKEQSDYLILVLAPELSSTAQDQESQEGTDNNFETSMEQYFL